MNQAKLWTGDGKDDTLVLYDYGQQADQTYRAARWRCTSVSPDFANPYRVWGGIYVTP